MKKLPVGGIQTFKKLREGECLYIDKTREAFSHSSRSRRNTITKSIEIRGKRSLWWG